MELWIRPQDGTTLMKVDRLDIDYSSGLYLIKSNGFNTLLANYKSEERALEVMDEIQEAQLGNYHYRCPSNVKVSNNGNMIIYEMPKE